MSGEEHALIHGEAIFSRDEPIPICRNMGERDSIDEARMTCPECIAIRRGDRVRVYEGRRRVK